MKPLFSHKVLFVCTSFIALPALSASFQILEQSPAHLGTAFSGTASNVRDASSVYFNPASIVELDSNHLTLGANAIFTDAQFTDRGSNTNGVEATTDEIGYVPNIYWTHAATNRISVGLGVNAPYGLASKYDTNWAGRYLATYSSLELANVNAVVAFRLTETLSLGLGVNYQYLEAHLESQFDSTLGARPDPTTDSRARIKGDADDVTADVSLYFQPTEFTRFGALWRQGGEFDLTGYARFTLNDACQPGAGYPTGVNRPTTGTLCNGLIGNLSGNVATSVEMPDTATISASHYVNDNWQVHADVSWTEWSTLQQPVITNTDIGRPVSALDLHYDDTMRYAVGITHESETPWIWRLGLAFDQAPQTHPELANPRIPDQDRVWFSAGFNYEISNSTSIDVGYTYIHVDTATLDKVDPQLNHQVKGEFDSAVHILGVQGNWRF